MPAASVHVRRRSRGRYVSCRDRAAGARGLPVLGSGDGVLTCFLAHAGKNAAPAVAIRARPGVRISFVRGAKDYRRAAHADDGRRGLEANGIWRKLGDASGHVRGHAAHDVEDEAEAAFGRGVGETIEPDLAAKVQATAGCRPASVSPSLPSAPVRSVSPSKTTWPGCAGSVAPPRTMNTAPDAIFMRPAGSAPASAAPRTRAMAAMVRTSAMMNRAAFMSSSP